MDRLLRAVLKPASHAQPAAGLETVPGECPEAGIMAAYVEGTVSPQEQAALDAHIVECGRCQETLAVLARDDSPQHTETAGERWFTWVTRPRLRWLIPITAVATVAVFFLATRPLIAPGGLTPPAEVTQMAQATPQEAPVSPPPSPVQAGGEVKRDTSIAPPSAAIEVAKLDKFAESPAKPSAESALKEEPARRQANQASTAKQVADAASVPSPVGQAAVDKKAAAEAAAGFADRVATNEKRARAVAEPAAAPVAVAPAATDVSARTGAAPKMAAADAVREAPLTAAGQEELRNELRGGLQAAPRTVEAPGGSVRWRFSSGGQIWRSADAGSTWHSQPSGVSADLFAGSAPSPATCWVVGAAGTVLLTRDGERWERRPFPLPDDLTSIEARNARNATITTRDGRQFATLDGGATWIPR
jgi:hypothetical protein